MKDEKNIAPLQDENTQAAVENVENNENVEAAPEKKENKFVSGVKKVFSTMWRWTKRTFLGASKELSDSEKFNVEAIESPLRMTVKSFFRNKVAVVALVIFLVMFITMFVGPLLLPYDLTYQDTNQKNIAPNFSMMKVSREVAQDCVSISSYSSFTVGLDGSGNVHVWGYGKIGTSGLDVANIPQEVIDDDIKFAAAGNDHAVAIGAGGKVYAWGLSSTGQFGTESMPMPQTVDVANVVELQCGYQASAIVMKDGSVIAWGNGNTMSNLSALNDETNVIAVRFMGNTALVLKNDGTFRAAGGKQIAQNVNGNPSLQIGTYLQGKQVVALASTYSTLAILTDDGQIATLGNFNYNENVVPQLENGERYVSVEGGNRHYTATTSEGRIVCWGSDSLGQCSVKYKGEFDEVIVGSFQNYVVKDGKVVGSWGLRGYLFGTDEFGRDVFARIIHGGRMTMTVGAVAVIVSAIIAIIVGCVSGYFGGWVDMLLMRVTEIFSAIPFLPFAMMLSMILRQSPIGEEARILMMMVILGLLSWTGLAHMIRGQVLAEREKEFVIAAKAMGVKEKRIAFKHILPNVVSVILVSVTLDFAGCMLTESSLSYLGFGVQPPNPTWGNMLTGAESAIVIQYYWWRWLFPALFLAIATICINIVGDTLRDVLDPRSSQDK